MLVFAYSDPSPEHQVVKTATSGLGSSIKVQQRGLRGLQRERHQWENLHRELEQHAARHGNAIGPPIDRQLFMQLANFRVRKQKNRNKKHISASNEDRFAHIIHNYKSVIMLLWFFFFFA